MINQEKEEEYRSIIRGIAQDIQSIILSKLCVDIRANPDNAQILSILWPRYHDVEKLYHRIRKITDKFPTTPFEKQLWEAIDKVSPIKNIEKQVAERVLEEMAKNPDVKLGDDPTPFVRNLMLPCTFPDDTKKSKKKKDKRWEPKKQDKPVRKIITGSWKEKTKSKYVFNQRTGVRISTQRMILSIIETLQEHPDGLHVGIIRDKVEKLQERIINVSTFQNYIYYLHRKTKEIERFSPRHYRLPITTGTSNDT